MEVAAEAVTAITFHILVLTLPIILTIAFTVKVAVEEAVKVLVAQVVQAAQEIVLMLMVTIHHTAE